MCPTENHVDPSSMLIVTYGNTFGNSREMQNMDNIKNKTSRRRNTRKDDEIENTNLLVKWDKVEWRRKLECVVPNMFQPRQGAKKITLLSGNLKRHNHN